MKHRFFCLLVAISLAITSSTFAKEPQRGMSVVSDSSIWGRYHALIIGINDYKEWPRLRTAVKDATVIRDTLVSRYGFDKKNVILRTDKSASRVQINRDLRYLAKSMRKNDNLFIYYAGHGQLDDFTGDGYWVPAEGALKDPSSWVANSYIKAVLSSEKLQAKNVVVIADSCYSGSMLRGGPSLMSLDDQRYREKLVQKASLRSRQVISSGGVEPVADGGADGHSLFAFYLINALRKNDREVIDLENLFHTKVWKPVTEIGNQRPNVGRLKTPMDQDGQFVLYNMALASAQAKHRQLLSRKSEKAILAGSAAITAPQTINAEEEMWKIVQSSTSIEDFTLFLNEYPNSRFRGAAKLKIQQLKRKQNAQRMTASVAPDVVKPKPVNTVTESSVSNTGVNASDGNYIKYSTGIVYDKKTNLEWYVGPDEDTNWHQADKWVKGLDIGGGGWQLPTESDLRSIYSPKTAPRNMSPLFETTGWWVWSIDTRSVWNRPAYYFGGHSKFDGRMPMSSTNKMRAFAVRSRKDPAQIKAETENPKVLYASVAPAVLNKGGLNSGTAAQNSYRLALLPIKSLNTWGAANAFDDRAIRGVASAINYNKGIKFEQSFKVPKDLQDSIKLFSKTVDIDENNVWLKKTFFSNSEPDWDEVKKLSKKIKTDLVALVNLRITELPTIDVYLYDYRSGKVYSQINQDISYNAVEGGVDVHVRAVIKEFLKSK
jgi:hypothetical protein